MGAGGVEGDRGGVKGGKGHDEHGLRYRGCLRRHVESIEGVHCEGMIGCIDRVCGLGVS